MCSRAVHGLAAFDTDTCSGWERRRCEWLCAASSTRQERPCFARSTTHARSLRSPAAAARRPTRGFARARSGPCATATPAVSTHASCHRHHRCQSAAPLPLLRLRALCSSPRELVQRTVARNGEAAAGHGHAHVSRWDLHGRVVRRQAARARRIGLHQRQQVRAARGRVCGRLRRHAAEAAWTREAAAGGRGRQRGGVRRAGTDGVRGCNGRGCGGCGGGTRGCLACLGAARACPAGGSVARWEHAAGHA